MLRTYLFFCLIGVVLLSACHVTKVGETSLPTALVRIPYKDLVLDELDRSVLTNPGIPGCILADLPPFGWKIVESGLVDIRTAEEYARQTESLYQEGYQGYLNDRADYPGTYQSIPGMSYEEFLAICNVFPAVDFETYSVLGVHAIGTACNVSFEKHVYRDDQSKRILYELTVIEKGACDLDFYNRNLTLVPRIPREYSVVFSISAQ